MMFLRCIMETFTVLRDKNIVFFPNQKKCIFCLAPYKMEEGVILHDAMSCKYIIFSPRHIDNFYKGGFEYGQYINSDYFENINNAKKYIDKYLKSVVDNVAKEMKGEKDSNKNLLGLDDEIVWAYLLANTDPKRHKYFRFVRWNEKSNGFNDFTNGFTQQLNLPSTTTFKGKRDEYYRIPTCIYSCGDTRHMFSVIYRVNTNIAELIYHDNLKSVSNENFRMSLISEEERNTTIIELKTQEPYSVKFRLPSSRIAMSSGCAFATMNFLSLITKKEIRNFNQNVQEELVNKFKTSVNLKDINKEYTTSQEIIDNRVVYGISHNQQHIDETRIIPYQDLYKQPDGEVINAFTQEQKHVYDKLTDGQKKVYLNLYKLGAISNDSVQSNQQKQDTPKQTINLNKNKTNVQSVNI